MANVKKQQQNFEECPSFGKFWDPVARECMYCEEEYNRDYEACKDLTQRRLENNGLIKNIVPIEDDDRLIADDSDEKESQQEPPSKVVSEKSADEPKAETPKVTQSIPKGDIVCEFREGSKSYPIYLSMVPKLGLYDKKTLMAKIMEDTKLTKSEVDNQLATWINPKYKPKWMPELEMRDGKVCKK